VRGAGKRLAELAKSFGLRRFHTRRWRARASVSCRRT